MTTGDIQIDRLIQLLLVVILFLVMPIAIWYLRGKR